MPVRSERQFSLTYRGASVPLYLQVFSANMIGGVGLTTEWVNRTIFSFHYRPDRGAYILWQVGTNNCLDHNWADAQAQRPVGIVNAWNNWPNNDNINRLWAIRKFLPETDGGYVVPFPKIGAGADGGFRGWTLTPLSAPHSVLSPHIDPRTLELNNPVVVTQLPQDFAVNVKFFWLIVPETAARWGPNTRGLTAGLVGEQEVGQVAQDGLEEDDPQQDVVEATQVAPGELDIAEELKVAASTMPTLPRE